MATTQSKRFEDWEEVDCNECARYWDSSCDGTSKGSKKPCNSYLATREIVIPARLNALETRVKYLEWMQAVFFLALAAYIVFS